jgi:hypothetical protein
MPVVRISRIPPIPEGEYAGVLTKVSSGFTQKTGEPRFTFDIKMKDGKTIKDTLYFGEKVSWRIVQIAKSANLILPEDVPEDDILEFVLTPDDLEGRIVYFGVKHNPGDNGRVYQNVNYHLMSYALQQNPDLAGMYPPQAPRHVRAASPENPPPETGTQTTAPLSPPPPVTPVSATGPGVVEAEDDTLSPAEFAQALERAKKNRAAKSGK